MAKASAGTGTAEIQILELERGQVSVAIVGTSPLICNRVSQKAMRTLLAPAAKKTTVEKQQTQKHDPLSEYRNSPYTLDDGPTRLGALSTWFKQAMMTAALELPGVKKTQIGRLVRVEGERVALFGIPQLFMAITRSADMARTPDVRTRCIVPKWAVLLDVTFASPTLKGKSVLNLLSAAGVFSGVGDWRTQKGSANFGSFRLASADDKELKAILKEGGRDAQIKALNIPTFYDDETEELFTWHNAEGERRGFKVAV